MKASQVWYKNGGGDEQYTPKETVELLLNHIGHLHGKTIWCPFDRNDSQFVQVLRSHGYKVVNSHIDYGQDFFEYEPKEWDCIISNPPYHNKRKFWERCCDLGKPFLLLLPVNILSDSLIVETLRSRERESSACLSRIGARSSITPKLARLAEILHLRLYIWGWAYWKKR